MCALRNAALVRRKPIDFHTSNIQRARTKRLALCIVRLGNPILWPPEGRLDYGLCNDKTQNGTTSLSGAIALFGVQRSFLPYLFCQDRKDMARGAADAALQIAPRLRLIRTAPPEASHAIRLKKFSPFPGLLLRAKLSTCGCGLFTNFLFTTAQQMFHKIACGQI